MQAEDQIIEVGDIIVGGVNIIVESLETAY